MHPIGNSTQKKEYSNTKPNGMYMCEWVKIGLPKEFALRNCRVQRLRTTKKKMGDFVLRPNGTEADLASDDDDDDDE